ncbi:HNH/ENDO VII family nuclease [Sediminispirochaeta bajacaliforniensis]|uniref:HNH/ENDO VII family nuclease n=1 Tax=Sediminispirochaeta bajacaliforniensis TaxID=148 RepID=UPI00036B98BD|nr:HNH/ENDO VII family nuclease [Sediminispirochaeta bajacaliforniensis]
MAEALEVKQLVLRSIIQVNTVYERLHGSGPYQVFDDELINSLRKINVPRLFGEIDGYESSGNGEEIESLKQESMRWLDLIEVGYADLLSENRISKTTFALISDAGPVIGVGRRVSYEVVQVVPTYIAGSSSYHFRWSVDNDDSALEHYRGNGAVEDWERGRFRRWVDESFGDPMDIGMDASYPGTHVINVDVYLNDEFLERVSYRQTVVEGDPELIELSFQEKLMEVLRRCNFLEAILVEAGDLRRLAVTMAVAAGIVIALQASGSGVAVEVVGLIAAAIGLGTSVPRLLRGIYRLAEAMELTGRASTYEAIEAAADKMEAAVAEIGVNGLWALLSYLGMRSARARIRTRIEQAGSVGAAENSTANLYRRPSSYRSGIRDKVWESAKNENALVRDPVTGRIMNKTEPWDMGHRPGYEFRKLQRSAAERGLSRAEFLDEYNTVEHYRPELPSSNRSHRGENLTNEYFGF